MIYISILVFLLFSCIIDLKKISRFLFFCYTMFLVLFLGFRFGQGTDYSTYATMYYYIPSNIRNIEHLIRKIYVGYNIEPFYFFLNVFVKKMNLGFTYVVFFASFISCLLIYKTIINYSHNFFLSLFIFYANYFFYFQSAIRQSLAMAIFLFAICEYIQKKEKSKYYLLCFTAMMFHTAAIISFFVPFFLRIKKFNFLKKKYFIIITAFCVLISFFIAKLILPILSVILPRYAGYVETRSNSFNILPVIIRLIFSYIFICLYNINRKKNVESVFNKNLLKIYVIGTYIYIILSPISISSRFTDFFTFLEIILFPNLIINRKIIINAKIVLIMFMFSILYVKDLREAILQDNYFSKKLIDYPYVTVFNMADINNYKTSRYSSVDRMINEYKR